jgi:hypothetical protein
MKKFGLEEGSRGGIGTTHSNPFPTPFVIVSGSIFSGKLLT